MLLIIIVADVKDHPVSTEGKNSLVLILKFIFTDILGKKPQQSDLLKLFQNSCAHYKIIGTALDVQVDDLHAISGANDDLIKVFQRWIDSNKEVTWRKVLEVCGDYSDKFGFVKAEVEEFLSSDRARNKYKK